MSLLAIYRAGHNRYVKENVVMGVLQSSLPLSELPLFVGLSETTLDAMRKRLERRSFRKGTALLLAGEHSGTVYIVQSGLVRVVTNNTTGENVLLGLLGPGEIIGEISALDNLPHSADVIADEDCVCWCMSANSLKECLCIYPDLAFNLLRLTVKRVRSTTEKIAMLSTQDSKGRIALQLLLFAHQCGVDRADGAIEIPIPITQKDLAALTGISRQTVNVAVQHFRAVNAISYTETHYVTIHRPDLLAHRCR